MKIYDISQEIFSCAVYPGDPSPKREVISSIENGDTYNLTAFSMCAHNGTHIDSPSHFIKNGTTVENIPLSKTVGFAYVAEHSGELSVEDALRILEEAKMLNPESAKRILIKGESTLTLPAAEFLAESGICLFGNESQTVGDENAPMAVHLALLGSGVVLLEGIRLANIPTGVYLLNAAPLSLGSADGAPCRAILIEQ